MSLRSRIVKLEVGLGSDRDLQAAEELLHRHAKVRVAVMFGADPDTDEAAWAKMAEKSGRIAAAEDFVRRYWRVRGLDIDERHCRNVEEIQGRLREIFGLPGDSRRTHRTTRRWEVGRSRQWQRRRMPLSGR